MNIDTDASPLQFAKWLEVAKNQRTRLAEKLEKDFGEAPLLRKELAQLGHVIQNLLTQQANEPKRK